MIDAEQQQKGTEAQAIIDVTREGEVGKLQPLEATDHALYSVIVPEGMSRETVDLRWALPEPVRARGTTYPQTVDDLGKYVTRHDDAAATTVWVDMDNNQIVAILDDHEAVAQEGDHVRGAPGWGEHRAVLDLCTTDQWDHWYDRSGQMMDQETFAEHIEDGQNEVSRPPVAELLEIAMSMQGHTNAEWKSATRLQDGSVHFLYSEDSTATAGGNGELEIPATFELLIEPFLGEEPVALTARLRYRIKSGKLMIGYKLDRPDDARRDAIDMIADRLAGVFGPHRVFVGTPREGAS